MAKSRKVTALLLAAFCFAIFSLSAQRRGDRDGAPRDRAEMMEIMQKYKRDFITKRLDLTRDQQNKFFPLYDEMTDEIEKVNSDSRDAERRIQSTDAKELNDVDYDMATNLMIEKGEKISAIEKKYYEKFKEILTPQQLYLLKTGDAEINKRLLEHIRRGRPAQNDTK